MAESGRTAVYQFFASTGRHVYIGMSNRPDIRAEQHSSDKWWWASVDHTRTRITWYHTRAKAHVVEIRLIEKYRPPGNKQHNPNWENSPAGRLYRSKSARRRRRNLRATPTERRSAVAVLGGVAVAGHLVGWWVMPPQLLVLAVVVTAVGGWWATKRVR